MDQCDELSLVVDLNDFISLKTKIASFNIISLFNVMYLFYYSLLVFIISCIMEFSDNRLYGHMCFRIIF